ncbi:MAG: hypothetical protein ABEJ65_12155 [bacterium]
MITKRLSKTTFLLIVVLVGFWMIFGMSHQREKTSKKKPPSELASFSHDYSATEVIYHLNQGRRAESRADWLKTRKPDKARKYYREARSHYKTARDFISVSSRQTGFMKTEVKSSVRVINKKLNP